MKVAIITVSKVEASVLFDAALSNYNICKFLASNATLVTAAKSELINYSVYRLFLLLYILRKGPRSHRLYATQLTLATQDGRFNHLARPFEYHL